MKKLAPYLLVLCILVMSCSTDDNTSPSDPEPVSEEEPVITATETCLFSDFDIQENTTVTIDCLLDLEGATINLPAGVTFNFDGGDVFNGTLNFGTAGKIDGALLNSDLILDGDISLLSEVFQFVPARWGIVEVTDPANPEPPTLTDAYNNHQIIQEVIDNTYAMGTTTFSINSLNAFFDSLNGEQTAAAILVPAILLPSNFNLKMTDNTFLRVFPASGNALSKLVKISQGTNIMIQGGNLIGDRLAHKNEGGGAALIDIRGGKHILVDGVHMSLSNATGLHVFSFSKIESDDYFGSDDVTVQNCVFDSNRSNNLALTDGQNIIFQNNKSYSGGNDMEASFGTSVGIRPKVGIITETQINQFIKNVIIRDNIVEDTQSFENHSILTVGSSNVIIEGNTTDKSISWSTALGVQVINNTSGGIIGGAIGYNGVDNIVSGNTITHIDGTGIFLTDQNVKVFDNDIIDCGTAIQLSSLLNAEVYNNNIVSSDPSSIGITGQHYLDNVDIHDNDFELEDGKALNILFVNQEEEHRDYQFNFTKNNIINQSKQAVISGSRNMDIINNDFNGAGINIDKASNAISIKDNVIINTVDATVFNINNSTDIDVTGNTFENTSDGTLSLGVTIGKSENSNIVFHDNRIKVLGINFGMVVNSDSNTMFITDNTFQNESSFREAFKFSGNNSEIRGNTFINTNNSDKRFLIEGNNNTVSGNN